MKVRTRFQISSETLFCYSFTTDCIYNSCLTSFYLNNDCMPYIMSDATCIMRVIIFSLLVLTPVNCQLAFIWLNHQQFQCAQNTRNYRDAVHHQYSCIFSLTWTCIRDLNDYTPRSVISLAYFCGFIDGQNMKQSNTIWHIHVKPNIHIHFTKFSLFNNFWYCDSELLELTSENQVSVFCGNHLPWVYDASAPSVSISLSTQRFGSTHYQVELQYYGAHVPRYQHFVVLLGPSSLTNAHIPDLMRNKFESFHFISNSKLDIVNVALVNMCSKQQTACHDGPGVKSPTQQLICNQSECICRSTTFQMFCKLSASAVDCLNIPQLNYQAVRAKQDEFKVITRKIGSISYTLQLNERVNKGSTKYIYNYYPSKVFGGYRYQTKLIIRLMRISFPYMLYEGNSCIYGGAYILQNAQVQDTFSSNLSEAFSLCARIGWMRNERDRKIQDSKDIILGSHFAIIIIHYKEYSTSTIIFEAAVRELLYQTWSCAPDIATANNKSITITLPYLDLYDLIHESELYLQSMLLNLRNIQYVYITFQRQNISSVIWFVPHNTDWFIPRNNDWCIYCTVFYPPHLSNIKGEEYAKEVLNRSFTKVGIIYSISINTSTCNPFVIPVWSLLIEVEGDKSNNADRPNIDTVFSAVLSGLVWWQKYILYPVHYAIRFWYMIHLIKPADIPPFAIYRVWMEVCHAVSHVSLEVPTDNHTSTSVYKWNHYNTSYNVYMTFDAAINILFESNDIIPRESCQDLFIIWFRRHFVYDDRVTQYTAGRMSEQSHFTFHNLK